MCTLHTHGESLQYDSRAPSCITSIRFTPMEGMIFQVPLIVAVSTIYSVISPVGD